MKAVIKGIISPDMDDLRNYVPSDREKFGVLLQLLIGPEDAKGFESFQTMLVTPQWLTANHQKEDVIIGRHYLIVFEFNYERIIQTIQSYLAECTGENWKEIASKIARLGHWEFEDYQV